MLYVIIGESAPSSRDRQRELLPQHLSRLRELQRAGRLVLGGACPAIDSPDPGPAGYLAGLTVAEFDSLEAAMAWADADPQALAGVWSSVTVRPFVRARAA
ncbi:MAG: hypothetical protein AMJ67_02885 [Betaproteobacteria bacterium SG8_41]|nr:MAG: hypothetical protein AMJ67_02885 [Betaproteobacteria bacterium SG8_41]